MCFVFSFFLFSPFHLFLHSCLFLRASAQRLAPLTSPGLFSCFVLMYVRHEAHTCHTLTSLSALMAHVLLCSSAVQHQPIRCGGRRCEPSFSQSGLSQVLAACSQRSNPPLSSTFSMPLLSPLPLSLSLSFIMFYGLFLSALYSRFFFGARQPQQTVLQPSWGF